MHTKSIHSLPPPPIGPFLCLRMQVLPHSSFVYDARFLLVPDARSDAAVTVSRHETRGSTRSRSVSPRNSSRHGGATNPPGLVGSMRGHSPIAGGADSEDSGGALGARLKRAAVLDKHALVDNYRIVTATFEGAVKVWELSVQRQRRLTLSIAHSLRAASHVTGEVVCEVTAAQQQQQQQQQQGQQQQQQQQPFVPDFATQAPVNALALDREHTRVFAGDAAGTVTVFLVDHKGGQVLTRANASRDAEMKRVAITCLRLDRSERRLLCLSRDATIRIMNVTNLMVAQVCLTVSLFHLLSLRWLLLAASHHMTHQNQRMDPTFLHFAHHRPLCKNPFFHPTPPPSNLTPPPPYSVLVGVAVLPFDAAWQLQKLHVGARHSLGVARFCLSPCGKFIFAGSEEGEVGCWSADSGMRFKTNPIVPTRCVPHSISNARTCAGKECVGVCL